MLNLLGGGGVIPYSKGKKCSNRLQFSITGVSEPAAALLRP